MKSDNMLMFLVQDDLALIREKSSSKEFKKGEIVLKEGVICHNVYRLVKGRVKVVTDVRGEEVVVGHLEPGELLGVASFLNGSGIAATAIASEKCECEVIAAHDLQSLLESVPGMAVRFYRSLGSVLADRLDLVLKQVTPPVLS
ncbi:MAG: cyclic nucleotide-binding domain-containing protein [Magnetococcales bacterium]|nr:cyclic nucleotide-binding domain-containing protein [Magnetococcales bacterium]